MMYVKNSTVGWLRRSNNACLHIKSTGTVAASTRESLRRTNGETLLHNLSTTNRYQSNDSASLSGSLPSSENIVHDTIDAYGTVRMGQGQRVILPVKSLYQRVSELWGECFWMERWHSLEHVLEQDWSNAIRFSRYVFILNLIHNINAYFR